MKIAATNPNQTKARSTNEGGKTLAVKYKSFINRHHARMHNVTVGELNPKSLQRRKQRAERNESTIRNRIADPHIEYSPSAVRKQFGYETHNKMTCVAHALSDYFELDSFENEVENLENHNDFQLHLKHLWYKMNPEISVTQQAYLFDVNRKYPLMGKSYEWFFSIGFHNWWKQPPEKTETKEQDDPIVDDIVKDNPLVEWLYVKQKEDGSLGVFALRKFEVGEVIGVYFGSDRENDAAAPSRFAVQSKHGKIDPLRGLTGGGTPNYFMAMHEAQVTKVLEDANAVLYPNMLVKASQGIEVMSEIIIIYYDADNYTKTAAI
jgi:hypothetical protein